MAIRLAEYQDFMDRVDANLLVRLTDQNGAGSPDQGKVETAADDATDYIYGVLGVNYVVPSDPHPQMLVRICVTIAIWYLGLSAPEGGLGEDWQGAYDQAVQMLNGIVAGTATLGVEDPQHTGERNQVIVNAVDTVFTEEKLGRY